MRVGFEDSGEHVVEPKGADGGQPPDDVLRLDPATRTLSWRGRSVRLTPAQASVMILLMRAARRPVSTGQIWKAVRGYVPIKKTSAVRVLVHELRRACAEAFGAELVETVRRRGYRLERRAAVLTQANVSEN